MSVILKVCATAAKSEHQRLKSRSDFRTLMSWLKPRPTNIPNPNKNSESPHDSFDAGFFSRLASNPSPLKGELQSRPSLLAHSIPTALQRAKLSHRSLCGWRIQPRH